MNEFYSFKEIDNKSSGNLNIFLKALFTNAFNDLSGDTAIDLINSKNLDGWNAGGFIEIERVEDFAEFTDKVASSFDINTSILEIIEDEDGYEKINEVQKPDHAGFALISWIENDATGYTFILNYEKNSNLKNILNQIYTNQIEYISKGEDVPEEKLIK